MQLSNRKLLSVEFLYVRVLRSGKVIPLPKPAVLQVRFTAETRFIEKVKLESDVNTLTRKQMKELYKSRPELDPRVKIYTWWNRIYKQGY